jgi:hypothetical protein
MSILKKTFDNKGNLVTEEILNKDSINDGYYRKWETGIIDKFETFGNFEDGKKNGSWFYIESGDTAKIENWFSGKKFGNQYEFFFRRHVEEPAHVYRFTFLSLDEEELSSIQFDPNQNIVKCAGLPLYIAYTGDTMEKNKPYTLMCFWGCPPNLSMKFRLVVTESDANGRVIQQKKVTDNDHNFDVLDFANRLVFEKSYTTDGDYKWKIVLAIFDKNNNEIIKDSSIVDLNVR